MKNTISTFFTFALLGMLVTGCAGTGHKLDERSKISSVSLNHQIEMPVNPLVGPSLELHYVDQNGSKKDSDRGTSSRFKAILDEQKIDFKAMLLDRADLHLKSLNTQLKKGANSSNADLRLKVLTYGLVKGYWFTTKPYITVKAELLSDGEIIWTDEFDAHGFSETFSVPMAATLQSPNLNLLFSSGIEYVLKDLESSLSKYLTR